MESPDILLMIVILIIPAVVIVVPRWLRSRERQRILDSVMQAAEKGITLPEAVIQSLIRAAAGAIASDPARDMRRGVFLTMIGLSIVVVGVAVLAIYFRTEGAHVGILIAAVGATPICIGLGYIGVARLGERARKNVLA